MRSPAVSQRQRLLAGQEHEIASHTITMRWRSDVASGWRFVFGDRVFAIDHVSDPDEMRRYLVCDVTEEGR